ncbi:MAG: UDP-glucose 4-epimerase [Blastocatellia bacterium]|nr:UDP-glucose 4-epimerase [Blastocatellia bacterium]
MRTLDSLKGKTVLVTGVNGFIGTHLVNRLRKDSDISLVLLSRKSVKRDHENSTWVVSALEQLSRETWLVSGLERIDVVFHLGAFTPKTHDTADLVEAIYRDNLIGTRSLLESLPSPPERIVFASTIDVYAPMPDGGILSESSPVQPTSLYGAAKLFCEQLIRTYAHKHGSRYAVLRYGHIFGPGEEAYEKLIPRTIRQLVQGESPVLYGDGSVERDFLYVDDAVEATLQAALTQVDDLDPVNIVRGASTPVSQIVEMLTAVTKFQGSTRYVTNRPGGHSFRFDNARMQESLGVWNFVPLAEGLEREVKYFQDMCK